MRLVYSKDRATSTQSWWTAAPAFIAVATFASDGGPAMAIRSTGVEAPESNLGREMKVAIAGTRFRIMKGMSAFRAQVDPPFRPADVRL
jgi:hypothetical protein